MPKWEVTDLNHRAGGGTPAEWVPIAYVITDFPGQGPTARVFYFGTDQHVYELYYIAGVSTWGVADLNERAGGGAPLAGAPIAYVTDFPGQGPTARVVYCGTDNHIYELSYMAAAPGWRFNDLNTAAGGPAGGAAPTQTAFDGYPGPIAYVTDFPGQGPTARVVYSGTDGNVYELRFAGPAIGWKASALPTPPQPYVQPRHAPTPYVTDFPGQGPTARVVYRGTTPPGSAFPPEGHIHELYYVAAAPGWGVADLNAAAAGGAPASGPPIAYVTDFQGQGPTARVLYHGTDDHIHELSNEKNNPAGWAAFDLNQKAGGGASVMDAFDRPAPVPYVTDFQGQGPTARVVYRGTDEHIYELYYVAAAAAPRWRFDDLNVRAAGGAPASGPPIAYVTDFPGQGPTARVLYGGTGGHIYELSNENNNPAGWAAFDLNHEAGGGAPAVVTPIAFVTDFPGQGPTARVLYCGIDRHIYELSYVATK